MRSSIEERIDELIFNTFKDRKYDSKEAQKWCNDTSEVIIKLLQEIVRIKIQQANICCIK